VFQALFVGHQGWLFSTPNARVLVDPILTEAIGHGGIVGRVYPPRILDVARFPPVDAVVYTHEHEDHFDIPSLNRIDRRVPVYLSGRSSTAATSILREMGFAPQLLHPGQQLRVSDLVFDWESPDHVNHANMDEWDVLPFLVRDEAGHGNFISTVDVARPGDFFNRLRQITPQPGLLCLTNNARESRYQIAGRSIETAPPLDNLALGSMWCNELAALLDAWGPPAALLGVGGGWVFPPPLDGLNRFSCRADSAAVLRAVQALWPDRPCLAPLPGHTITMRDGRVQDIAPQAPFLRPAPLQDWPARGYVGDGGLLDDYPPACGRATPSADDWAAVESGLAQLASFLYGREEFKQLYSLDGLPRPDARPSLALILKIDSDEGWRTMEYEPQAAAFIAREAEIPPEAYLAGAECWATDFAALVRGEIAPTSVLFGRSRWWNNDPEVFQLSLPLMFSRFFHPLSRPEAALSLYRGLLRRETPVEHVVRHLAGPAA
jgi:hypothetical protein